jgi:hypothetical protein
MELRHVVREQLRERDRIGLHPVERMNERAV